MRLDNRKGGAGKRLISNHKAASRKKEGSRVVGQSTKDHQELQSFSRIKMNHGVLNNIYIPHATDEKQHAINLKIKLISDINMIAGLFSVLI